MTESTSAPEPGKSENSANRSEPEHQNGTAPTALKNLRDYLEALDGLGELQPIDEEVALDLELGAIIRRCYETGAPAPLFNRITGVEDGFRVLGAPAGISRQPGLQLARVALSLGLPPSSNGNEIVSAVVDTKQRPLIPPVIVDDAPCLANARTGEHVDITRYPAGILHHGDGGRYLNTYGCIVARTPDGSWTNWSIARIMVIDRASMTGLVAPEQHIGMIRSMWAAEGKPMPFALALGVEPAIPFICGAPLPAHASEAEYLGALLGRPIETVRCATVPLEAPASAEILIEGFLSTETADTAPEGPMGEFAGYLWPGEGRPQPVYHVTATSHRDDPILPVAVAGEPVEENHTVWGVMSAAEILAELRQAQLPVTTAWAPLDAVLHWLVVTVPKDWRRRSGLSTTEDLCRRIGELVFSIKAGAAIPKLIVLNDDIDPTNTREVVWAFATRCHPTRGNVVFDAHQTAPLIAYLGSSEKLSATTTKIVYNGLPPDELGDALPVRSSFRHAYPAEIVQRVLSRWHSYGFAEAAGD
jgi:UbiD family decarboxylase